MSAHPVPVAELWEWQHRGLCRFTNPEVFFHPEGERGPSRRRREARAVAICHQCPVMQECREHALRVQEPFGTWGGLTEDDRQTLVTAARAPARSQAPAERSTSATGRIYAHAEAHQVGRAVTA